MTWEQLDLSDPWNRASKCEQLDCSGGDNFSGRAARWIGPMTHRIGGLGASLYCGTCKREAIARIVETTGTKVTTQ